MTEKITPKTLIPICAVVGIVGFISAGVWWASYITVRVERIEEIRAKVERTEQAVNEIKGQVSIISQALGINKSVSINQ